MEGIELFTFCVVGIIALGVFFFHLGSEFLTEKRELYRQVNLRSVLNDYKSKFDIDLIIHSDNSAELSFVNAGTNEVVYVGTQREGFLYNMNSAVGFSPSKEALDTTRLPLEDIERALSMCVDRGFLKQKDSL